MSLAPGTRLGVYEVAAAIGQGGMGEVYRARDTKLHRDVALKILPDLFAADPDRLARFEREAQVLASLNHPNIAAIYGFEESSPSTGSGQAVRALVLELVDGPTLADRVARGPIPVDEALPIARQIAEALEAAHEHGIIHRDLKPANIKVRDDGTVKVLDFGLAKALDDVGRVPRSGPAGVADDVTHSPTLSLAGTRAGVILGTAAYMAPEQAKGRPADKRSDIWAFACVLYEMLTGKRAFEGEDVSDTLANLLKIDPNWTALPADLPLAMRTLLRRCLEKDRRKRIADIAAALFVIEEHATLVATPGPQDPSRAAAAAAATPVGRRRIALPVVGALLIAALAGSAVWFAVRPAPPRVARVTITPTGAAALAINGNSRDLAITPDGARVVYAGNNGTQLFVRALDSLEPTVIVNGIVSNVFVSPDGQWVGFSDNFINLNKVAMTGGPPLTLGTGDGSRMRGATWAPDDTIIFATNSAETGLQRIPAAGGEPTVLTRPDRQRGDVDHFWPEMLPGGAGVLFTVTTGAPTAAGLDSAQIAVLDLETGAQTILLRGGSHAHYVPTGHLVYTASGTLRAVAFDLDRLETVGTPVPILPRLVTTSLGGGDFGVAENGTLVYVDAPAGAVRGAAGGGAGAVRTLVWVDRTGREQPIPAPPRAYMHPRVSPDGARLALWIGDQGSDVWIWALARATLSRLTFDPADDNFPLWTPDGQRLVFGSGTSGVVNLFWQAADGTGSIERLTQSNNVQLPSGISADGRHVIFSETNPKAPRDLMMVSLDKEHRVEPLVQTPFEERNGIVSPDGRWLAYESDGSGRFEVYVRPFPNVAAGQWQVSTTGGVQPLWARSGSELFYLAADGALTAVPVEASGASWNAGTPRRLIDGRYFSGAGGGVTIGRTYDVSPDGQRFVMIKEGGGDQTAAPPQIIVVQNWLEELRRLVPVN